VPPVTERDVVRAIRLGCCELADLMVNAVGVADFGTHKVTYGLGGPGGSDLVGQLRGSGRFAALEVKRPGWRPRNAKDKARWASQVAFLKRVRRSGGIGAAVDCLEDARGVLAGELDPSAPDWVELPADRLAR